MLSEQQLWNNGGEEKKKKQTLFSEAHILNSHRRDEQNQLLREAGF